MQQLMLQPNDPRLGMVVRTENDITNLTVDIVVEEGADVQALQALQAEEFAGLLQLVGSLPMLATPPVIKALIGSSSLRTKHQLIEAITGMEQAASAPNPMAQAAGEADIRGKHAKASADEALAALRGNETIKRVAETEALATSAPWVNVGVVGEPIEKPEPGKRA